MTTRVAINGFGRIGRAFYKLAKKNSDLEIVAVNDLSDKDNLEYLLRHDSVYGLWEGSLDAKFIQEKDPAKLPWKDLNIDIVVESSGAYESYEKARAHIAAGAKRVVITAPAKDEETLETKTVLMGVNEKDLKHCIITSNGSCTTNSASPVMEVLNEKLGIKKAFLNTAHGYTATQSIVDSVVKGSDYRRGRAAAINIVPSTTVPQPDQESQTFTQSESFNFNQTEQSPEVLQAIEEQKAADQSYDSWQDGNRELYSWIRKLPLSATNYFVYFDLNREVFIGRLYPAPGEDTERLKSDILNTLKLEKEIPVENFKFEWLVNP